MNGGERGRFREGERERQRGFVALPDVGDVEWSTKYCFAAALAER